ncbi:hypothetical protein BHM03_00038286 [Ensete ventricosum]|uniref:Cytochrome P450 n=1 Tax=Ensete ventricosum TaxID=4639 RepID=A0A445MJX1_ENSVE|nr:hypothetical protein BHM03_00038286 [Ensete ventricosum]
MNFALLFKDFTPKAGTFLPFGGGSRLCPGNELAKLEIAVFLHHFLLGYDSQPYQDVNPIHRKPDAVDQPNPNPNPFVPLASTAILLHRERWWSLGNRVGPVHRTVDTAGEAHRTVVMQMPLMGPSGVDKYFGNRSRCGGARTKALPAHGFVAHPAEEDNSHAVSTSPTRTGTSSVGPASFGSIGCHVCFRKLRDVWADTEDPEPW